MVFGTQISYLLKHVALTKLIFCFIAYASRMFNYSSLSKKLNNYNSACSSQTGHKVFDLTEVRNFSFPMPIMQYASLPPFPFSKRFRAFVTKIKRFFKTSQVFLRIQNSLPVTTTWVGVHIFQTLGFFISIIAYELFYKRLLRI